MMRYVRKKAQTWLQIWSEQVVNDDTIYQMGKNWGQDVGRVFKEKN